MASKKKVTRSARKPAEPKHTPLSGSRQALDTLDSVILYTMASVAKLPYPGEMLVNLAHAARASVFLRCMMRVRGELDDGSGSMDGIVTP